MSLGGKGQNLLKGIWKTYANDMPKFTTHSTIAGWILAIAGNVFGVAIDKKVDTKEKKYLIPREIGDGVANILLFLCITKPMTKFVNKLVEDGKIGFKNSVNPEKLQIDKNVLKSGLGVGASLLGAVIVSNIFAPIIRNVLATRSQKKYLDKQQNPIQVQNNVNTQKPTSDNVKRLSNMDIFLNGVRSNKLRV